MTWSSKPELLQQPADGGDRRWSIVHVNPSFLESAVPATFAGLFPAERDNKLIKVFYHNGSHSQILIETAAAATHYNLITKWGKNTVSIQAQIEIVQQAGLPFLHYISNNHLYISSNLSCFHLSSFNHCSSKNSTYMFLLFIFFSFCHHSSTCRLSWVVQCLNKDREGLWIVNTFNTFF